MLGTGVVPPVGPGREARQSAPSGQRLRDGAWVKAGPLVPVLLPGWVGQPPPPAVCSGIPGTGLGPKAERVPLLPKGLWHTGVTQPRHFGGSGCERGGGTDTHRGQPRCGSASPPPQNGPRPLRGKARPRGWQHPGAEGVGPACAGAAPSVPVPPRFVRGKGRGCGAARPGEEGTGA